MLTSYLYKSAQVLLIHLYEQCFLHLTAQYNKISTITSDKRSYTVSTFKSTKKNLFSCPECCVFYIICVVAEHLQIP